MYCIVPALIDRRIGVRPRNVQGLHYRRIGLVRWRPAALAHVHDVHVIHMYNALAHVYDVRARNTHVQCSCTRTGCARNTHVQCSPAHDDACSAPRGVSRHTTTTVPAGVILGQLS